MYLIMYVHVHVAAFKAPDLDPLLEDSHMELDEEDVQWRVWLQELMHGGPPTVSDSGEVEEDDQDYNFLADQGKCSEEIEEYRNDKAVKIPGWWWWFTQFCTILQAYHL